MVDCYQRIDESTGTMSEHVMASYPSRCGRLLHCPRHDADKQYRLITGQYPFEHDFYVNAALRTPPKRTPGRGEKRNGWRRVLNTIIFPLSRL